MAQAYIFNILEHDFSILFIQDELIHFIIVSLIFSQQKLLESF